jgi:G3E family GTPase
MVAQTQAKSVPVTILTGYLGAGKTTLLNHLLTQKHGQKIAVIINEFGQIGIDNQLIRNSDDEIFEMHNGSICCTVRKELVQTISALMEQQAKFDHLVIETTGLADPAPVVQTFFVDETMKAKTHLEAVVTVVDAKHVLDHWDAKEVQEQLLFANVILLNKVDLVSAEELAELERHIRAVNRIAALYHTRNSEIELQKILGLEAFDVNHALAIDDTFLNKHVHEHDKTVSSVAFAESGTLDRAKLDAWINDLLKHRAADIFRLKGIFNLVNDDRRYILQGIHTLLSQTYDRSWHPNEARKNELVLIGRNLDEDTLRQEFLACFVQS